MECEIKKLGWRQYYAYYYTDGWHLLDFYHSEKDALNGLKLFNDECKARRCESSRKSKSWTHNFELE